MPVATEALPPLTLFRLGGGSKVPAAPKMPSKLRKSKKIQKNNYIFEIFNFDRNRTDITKSLERK